MKNRSAFLRSRMSSSAVERGEAEFGMLPLENNNVGGVDEVRKLLDRVIA